MAKLNDIQNTWSTYYPLPKLIIQSFIALLIGATPIQALQAQGIDNSELPQEAFSIGLDQAIPLSPNVVRGTLDNGLRYYILENSEPLNRAELRLVVNVGSLAEDDDQLGLAHFLEHMAFNGTRNFQKQELVEFMESLGMRLGPGLNASTSSSETIYKLQVPLDKEDNLETAFLIMQDWAWGMTLDSEEIDKERGVVIEEWRRQQGAQNRIRQQQLPVVLNNSRHVDRQPIGTLESLQNFDHDAMRRFYKDWYRPDLMAVVAVGDFNAMDIEALIKENFSQIPKSDNPRTLQDAPIAPHEDTRVAIATDEEIRSTSVTVYYKKPEAREFTIDEFRVNAIDALYFNILYQRLQELSRTEDAPFINGLFRPGRLDRNNVAYTMSASVKEDSISKGLEAVLTEVERMARYGPSDAELNRHKESILKRMEQAYYNRHEQQSAGLINGLIQEYLTDAPVMDISYSLALQRRFISNINSIEISQVAERWMADTSRVITLVAPDKEGINIPSQTDLLSVLEQVPQAIIAPREDDGEEQVLLAETPDGSPVIETRQLPLGITEWTLANGVRVVYKVTDFREEQFNFTAYSPGGNSLATDEDYIAARTAPTLIYNSGVGEFSAVELGRILTGKLASVGIGINEFYESVNGSGSNSDMETLFQLIYLRMTAPRAENTVYENYIGNNRDRLANRDTIPSTLFSDTWNRLLYSDHPRRQPFTVDTLEHVNLDKAFNFYKERFADAGDFVFIFVGDIDPEQLKPLAETYLGALPNLQKQESWRDTGVRNARGVIKEKVYRGKEPTSNTRITFSGDFTADAPYEQALLRLAADTFQEHLRNLIREELGATYSVNVSAGYSWRPVQQYSLTISFNCDPERVDELTAVVFEELEKFKIEGPDEQALADAIEARLKSHEVNLESNTYWMSYISQAYFYDTNSGVEAIEEYPLTLSAATIDTVRQAAVNYFDINNYLQMSLLPSETRSE